MTTTLIEKCLALDTLDIPYHGILEIVTIIDPGAVNMEDLKNMRPGKIIRLNKEPKLSIEFYGEVF